MKVKNKLGKLRELDNKALWIIIKYLEQQEMRSMAEYLRLYIADKPSQSSS